MFKFIHTADIHLDSPLRSLALRNTSIADLIGEATRRTFEKIIDLCLEEQVDALIIAGDLYDGDLRCMRTAAFLARQMRRLEEAKIQVFMIRGNHDSEAVITNHLTLPENVRTFTGKCNVIKLEDLGVAIHGVSYAHRHVPESLLHKYNQPVPNFINIGIMHTSLMLEDGHDVYAPCTVSELIAHGFDYWALGHIHQRQIYSENPFVVMPGIPQGRHIGEEGPKSVTIVEVSDKSIQLRESFVSDSEFWRVPVDLSDIVDWPRAITELRKAFKEIRRVARASYVICRIILQGKTPLYWRIRRDADLFKAEALDAAQGFNVLVEEVDNQTERFFFTSDDADPIDELEALMIDGMKDSSFLSEVTSFLENAVSKMPPELRERYDVHSDRAEDIFQRLLSQGITDVIAALKDSRIESEVS